MVRIMKSERLAPTIEGQVRLAKQVSAEEVEAQQVAPSPIQSSARLFAPGGIQ
jgi:hypothetical protein